MVLEFGDPSPGCRFVVWNGLLLVVGLEFGDPSPGCSFGDLSPNPGVRVGTVPDHPKYYH